MSRTKKVFAIFTLLAAGALPGLADQTNVVQHLSFQLMGLTQGPTVTNRNSVDTSVDFTRVGNRQVIQALGLATGHAFSRNADLVVVTPLGGGSSSIQVRDAGTTVDVTTYFTYQVLSGSVGNAQANLRTGRASGSNYFVEEFALIDAPGLVPLTLHFDVRGVASETWTTTPNQGTRSEVTAEVTGSGDNGGVVLILQGSVQVQGYSLEVVSGGWTT